MERSERKSTRLTEAQRDEIREAPAETPTSVLAARYGTSEWTVRQLRSKSRRANAENEGDEEPEPEHTVPDVSLPCPLSDLGELRLLAGKNYRASGRADDGRLWLATINESLDRLGIEGPRDPLEGMSDDVILAELETRLGLVRPECM